MFFFYLHDDLQQLHSFPTRRSSDLDRVGNRFDLDRARRPLLGDSIGGNRRTAQSRDVSHRRLTQRANRSEEHTSELQSPCNLVCRLLLEKKKKTKNKLSN